MSGRRLETVRMSRAWFWSGWGAAVLSSLLVLACAGPALAGDGPAGSAPGKVVWVDSYHQGFEWSDGIGRGLASVLEPAGVELIVFRLDTKRNQDPDHGWKAGREALELIRRVGPDVVVASDDNAQIYLAAPFLKNTDQPVVFCGVNWDADLYGYPARNVTGMLEVDLLEQMTAHLRRFSRGDRIAYIGGDTNTGRKLVRNFNIRYFRGRLKGMLVSDFEDFKKVFIRAMDETDMLIIGNYAGINGWRPDQAEEFLAAETRIPTGCFDRYSSRYAVFTLGKVAEEQGEWAGKTALRIMDGEPASGIPIAENKEFQLVVNLRMAESAGVVVPISVLEKAVIIGGRPGQ